MYLINGRVLKRDLYVNLSCTQFGAGGGRKEQILSWTFTGLLFLTYASPFALSLPHVSYAVRISRNQGG